MATWVLVHGGWHGAWCWDPVAAALRAAGHRVLTPVLTGLGERAAELDRTVDLATHVADVARVLPDGERAVLVGHSYAGLVVAGVADREPGRVRHVVFLDAFVPADGASLFSLLRPERREVYEQAARERGDGWLVPPPPAVALGFTGAAADDIDARLTPQPLATFTSPLPMAAPLRPGTFVHCTEGPLAPSFAPFAARLRTTPGWAVHEIATGHDAMLTAPDALVRLLLAAG